MANCDACGKNRDITVVVLGDRWLKFCSPCLDGAVKFILLGTEKFRGQDAGA